MPFTITVTDAGRVALINAEHTGTAPVAITEIGLSETAIVPDPAATVLVDEIKRVSAISGEVVAPDTIHVTMFDDGPDAYSMRSFGVYLADGTLFAIYGQADPVVVKTAASIASLAVDVRFVDVNAESVTFGDTTFSNPPATTERQGVVELATIAEAIAGIDALRALTPAAGRAAVLSWLLGQDGSGSGLDADMLDGQDGSWYANIPARLGFTPLDAAAFTANAILTRIKTVDGAASGLDADLLDGKHAAAFLQAVDATKFGSNSAGTWEKRANGFLDQAGLKTGSWTNEAVVAVSFPLPFGSVGEIIAISVTPVVSTASIYRDLWCQVISGTVTKNGFSVQLQADDGDDNSLQGFYWSVRGKQ
ncbi:hypothetical protein [Croceicoccus sp. BE223]|uniref:hypothetical protein n=1 Tax=Croceicoccus sp. BE223 TaxID=2817716 RepID=UPI002861F7C3|nr:hypothetical protein [Croceicoccus sp. BE223]MDR7101458.1 hypothetical protein [Croceicoccus sp. BE223]